MSIFPHGVPFYDANIAEYSKFGKSSECVILFYNIGYLRLNKYHRLGNNHNFKS